MHRRVETRRIAERRHLDDEIVGEALDRAAVRDVDGELFARVVDGGIDHGDGELELADAGARMLRGK